LDEPKIFAAKPPIVESIRRVPLNPGSRREALAWRAD